MPTKSFLQAAIDGLSAEIAAGQGGIIYDVLDANGNRTETLILCDEGVTPSTPPEQCQHIWRINKAGIGYSDDYGQTYRLAITASGQIVADFITTGTMLANIIRGGTLALGGIDNGNGVFSLLDASGNTIGTMDNDGLKCTNVDLSGLFSNDRTVRYAKYPSGYEYITYKTNFDGAVQRFYKRDVLCGSIAPHTYLDFDNEPGQPTYSSSDDSIYNLNIRGGTRLSFGLLFESDGQSHTSYNSRDVFVMYYNSAGDLICNFFYGILQYNGIEVAKKSSSSRRYKDRIVPLTAEKLDPHRLYNLPAVQFEYIADHPLQYADMKGQTLPGFIAEDVAEIYPAAVIHGADGQVESWDERRIIPGLLALVQEQKQEIDALTARVEKLERMVAGLVD